MEASKYKEPYATSSDEEIRRIARLLKEAREAKGLSQLDVAEILGVSQSSVCNFESGRSQNRFKFVVAYALALDLTIEMVLTKNNYDGFRQGS